MVFARLRLAARNLRSLSRPTSFLDFVISLIGLGPLAVGTASDALAQVSGIGGRRCVMRSWRWRP
jgi:hypothetical protein